MNTRHIYQHLSDFAALIGNAIGLGFFFGTLLAALYVISDILVNQ